MALDDTSTTIKAFSLQFVYDTEVQVWCLTAPRIYGLVMEEPTVAIILDELGVLLPEIMALNGQVFPEDKVENVATADLRGSFANVGKTNAS